MNSFRRFLSACLFLLSVTAMGQTVNRVEYFWDTDPGLGQGTRITGYTASANVTINTSISTSQLTPGCHMLGLRGRTNSGYWTPTAWHRIVVGDEISRIEYFFDDDPGFGNGIAYTNFTSGSTVTVNNASINVTGVGNGIHTLGIRAKCGNTGIWSSTCWQQVLVNNRKVTKIEYFYDNDPGYGQGIAYTTFTPNKVVNIEHGTLNATGISDGIHMLGIRAKGGDNGLWSPTYWQQVIVNKTGITAIEYYWDDNDPGIGLATKITGFSPALQVNITKQISTASLTPGIHTIALRARSAIGMWSPTYFRTVLVEQKAEYAEYYWDSDPGFGNATPIPITPDTVVMVDLQNIPVPTTDGLHVLNIRARAGNMWSPTYTQSYCIGPEPRFSLLLDSNVVCQNEQIIILDETQGTSINTRYTWDMQTDGMVDDTTRGDWIYSYTQPGSFTITMGVGNDNTCQNTYTQHIEVMNTANPTVSITRSTNNVCAGTEVTFVATAGKVTAHNEPRFSWYRNDTLIAGANSDTLRLTTLRNNDKIHAAVHINTHCAVNNTAASSKLTMRIYPMPNVVMPSLPIIYTDESAFILTNRVAATPTGGTYRINGNVVQLFNPKTNTPGEYEISYTSTNSNGCTMTVTDTFVLAQRGNHTIAASANPTAGGTVSGAGTYTAGTSCTLTATARNSYTFSCWKEGGTVVSTEPIYTFTVTGSRTLVAEFTPPSYNIVVSANPSVGGAVTGGGTYARNTTCTLTATPNTDYTFVNWTSGTTVVSTSPTYSFTVTSNKTLTANFVFSTGCGITLSDLPYADDFDHYTTSTTAKTGVEPTCWTLAKQDVSMTNEYKPMVYYSSANAHSGNYSLILNKRGIYAMPEFDGDVSTLQLSFYLKQTQAKYQLQVGVMSNLSSASTFVPVATIDNSTTGMEQVIVDFSTYTGNGRYIAFRNILASGNTGDYSCNYIDDLTLDIRPQQCGIAIADLPYTDNFDSYTSSTIAKTGVEPDCWTLAKQDVSMTNEYKPMVYYSSANAHSGNYSLILNKRGIYAMPEFEGNVSTLQLSMYLKQSATKYQLQVGVMSNLDNASTFVPVATLNNSGTGYVQRTVNFSSYTGNGHYIAFRNILASGNTGDFSCNYIDDLTLSQPVMYTITATANPTAGGSVTGTGEYASGSTCTLTATPNTNYTFTNWTVGNTVVSTNAIYSFTVTANRTLKANFTYTPPTYTVTATANPTAGGSITGAGSYSSGSTCSLTATPATGYAFSNWTSGNTVVSTNATYSFTVTANRTLTANFTPIVNCGISIDDLPYTDNFDHYTNSTTAKTGVEPPCWTLAKQDVSMTNEYKPMVYYSSSMAHSGNYSLILNKRGIYAMPEYDGDVSTLQLSFYLKQTQAKYQLQVGVMSNLTNASTFVPVATINNSSTNSEQVTVDFSTYTGNGRYIAFRNILASGNTGDYSCNYIDDLTLDVRPQQCGISIADLPYTDNFDSYTTSTTAKTGVEPTCWTLAHQDVSMTDEYKPMIYYASANAHSGNYSLILNKRGIYAMPEFNGDVNTLQLSFYLKQSQTKYQLQVGVMSNLDNASTFVTVATLNNSGTGYVQRTVNFSSYTGNGHYIAFRNILAAGNSGDYSCNYIDDLTLSQPVIYTITATANPTAGGSVTGGGEYASGSTCTLTATPNTNYTFANWTVGNTVVSTNATYSFTVTANRTLKANFTYTPPTYTVTATANPTAGGSITGAGSYSSGSTCSLTATPATGYAFSNWTSGNTVVSTNATYSFTVTANRTLTANFTPIVNCGISIDDLPYTDNFDHYTNSTTAKTGVEPPCWTLAKQDVSMTNEYKPMVYYSSSMAHSGNYSLILNKRGIYAMPEYDGDVSTLQLSFYLKQTQAKYQLQVGVMSNLTNASTFVPVATINNSSTNSEQVTVDFSTYTGNGRYIAFRNILASGNTGDYSCNYIDDLTLDVRPQQCGISIADLPYTDNFDSYTTSTTAKTGVEPTCWTLAHQDVSMTDAYKPMIYYASANAHSGNYSLLLNKRGIYAMPEFEGYVSTLQLSMYLKQSATKYQLQVGVMSNLDNASTFVPVATIDNSTTGVEHVTVNFSSYTGTGHYIAFRNILASGYLGDFSCNYIDNLRLETRCSIYPDELPYTENFDGYTALTTAKTGVTPDCWTLVHQDVAMTDEYMPMIYYNASCAHNSSYSLILNKRCIFAMPAVVADVNTLQMEFYVRQTQAKYQLQVGVLSSLDDYTTFVPVATINNSSTTTSSRHVVNFSSYTGNGHFIAFRNILASGQTGDYSCNYIDNINLRTASKGDMTDDSYNMEAPAHSLTLYPNPTTGILNVEADEEVVRVDVFDYTGRCVASFERQTTVDLGRLATGLYTLRVTLPERIEVRRVVKQ